MEKIQTKVFSNVGDLIITSARAGVAAKMIDDAGSNGKFFSVKFVKKDGSIRQMNCRLGVVKHLRGGERTLPRDYIVAFDVNADEKGGYRAINPATVLAVNGKEVG
jgi:hypothetical protein